MKAYIIHHNSLGFKDTITVGVIYNTIASYMPTSMQVNNIDHLEHYT